MAGTKRDAEAFARKWAGRGDEVQDGRTYWIDLFQNVLGVEDALSRLRFEVPVKTDSGSSHSGYVDVLIPSARALVEQKSYGIDLDKPERRQGRMVTPAQQGYGYAQGLPLSQQPRYVITCNFGTIRVHDRETDPMCRMPPKIELSLEDLPKNVAAIQFLKGTGEAPASVQRAVSIEAGRIMGEIHDLISARFLDPDSPESHHALSVICTRLMFLMFCEDAGLIGPTAFRDYIAEYPARDLRRALKDLFRWLDTPDSERDPYDAEGSLGAFPYMDGGLFREDVEIPNIDDTIRTKVLVEGCQEFDWSGVDPTVFGSIFEGALSHDKRRAGGMHYTSPENIHRVIDPLFLDGIKADLESALSKPTAGGARTKALRDLQDRMGSLVFLDPACGSGNFLTETYLCLRRIENRILSELQSDGQAVMDFSGEGTGEKRVKVSLANFHGIEVNDFASCVARTALWIAEKQADVDTQKVIRRVYDPLPLREYDTVVLGNALRADWLSLVPSGKVDYVMGNPPFIGHQWRDESQQEDVSLTFGRLRGAGKLDYVCCWFERAAELARTGTQCAFVSTNSICQGESVGILWRHMADLGVSIDFARTTFVWNSEADDEAHVHVVIVGFSAGVSDGRKRLYRGDEVLDVDHINGYLAPAPDVFIENRGRSVNPGAPEMTKGSQPTDGGNLILSGEERDALIKRHPVLDEVIRPYVGGREFLNGGDRWCLWFHGADLSRYAFPEISERLKAVAAARSASPTKSVQDAAKTPYLFTQIRQPETDYLAIPEVSSGRRKYLSVGYMKSETIASNKLRFIPTDSLYIFGLLSSLMHAAWMRVVAGRLKSDYSYSPAVYNSFVFPSPTDEERREIEEASRAVLAARSRYGGTSLAGLYDPDKEFFYPDLYAAHAGLDEAVERAYGVSFNGDEEGIVAHLCRLYDEAKNR